MIVLNIHLPGAEVVKIFITKGFCRPGSVFPGDVLAAGEPHPP
jgi:hypothetical protein